MSILKLICLAIIFSACTSVKTSQDSVKKSYSGIYPHLAYYNNEGECGTGAVVPWADRLWVITYGPHLPYGSSDKLYEITPGLKQIVRKESIGGTPANRMIHQESKQLFIGPYAIDQNRNVKVISNEAAPGRYTGTARHLSNPGQMIYMGTMEEGFYEVDVNSLKTKTLYTDGNVVKKHHPEQYSNLLPGAHGKGLYSGQGVMVYTNNGEPGKEALEKFDIEAGVLAEWDGKKWKVVRRNQFVEVTGPGGIYGNANPATDPIWATGWDHKSVLLGERSPEHGWTFYRLPKASHTYDGAHGWNTEWPRIRDVGRPGKPDYLMTMHGLFWTFPAGFAHQRTAGIRPRSAYLKVIGDYTRWGNQLVFGCDDSAEKEFLNVRKIKGAIEGPGQSNSNLWFTSTELPDQLGPNTAEGAVWLSEEVKANKPSDPFLFAGWQERSAWALNESAQPVTLTFEIDLSGNGNWTKLTPLTLKPGKAADLPFDSSQKGEWIRVRSDRPAKLTVHFSYTDRSRFHPYQKEMFSGLAGAGQQKPYTGGLLRSLGNNRRSLGLLAGTVSDGRFTETGYYELTGDMKLIKKDDDSTAQNLREKMAIPHDVVTVDGSSVLVTDDKGRRWRLPLGAENYTADLKNNVSRICREVATERDLLNVHGTFYELPAENADGFAKIRPIASHQLRVNDYASYRGLLVLTGIEEGPTDNAHIITSADGKAKVWAGAIDDLWKLGKPLGKGGPWLQSAVVKNIPSDPYLIGFYDQRSLELSHDQPRAVTFKIQAEPIGHGPWMTYKEVVVKPGETYRYTFPSAFQSRWIRFESNTDCKATAWLIYK